MPLAITRPSFITITRSLAAHDEVEIVLDEQERDARLRPQSQDVLEQLRRERRVDAGHRLVEQHQRGSVISTRAKSSSLRWPPESDARVVVRVAVEPDEREQLGRALARPSLAPARAPGTERQPFEPLAGMARRREQDVLEHGHARQRARHLERAHEARAARCGAAARGRSARPSNCTVPRSAERKPGDELNSVDLPAPFGPIRAVIEPASTSNDASSTARSAAEGAHDLAHLEDRGHSSTISFRLPKIPCGRKSIRPMITSPITISRR